MEPRLSRIDVTGERWGWKDGARISVETPAWQSTNRGFSKLSQPALAPPQHLGFPTRLIPRQSTNLIAKVEPPESAESACIAP